MDFITSSAIEEICAQGTDGLLLASLWPKLVPELSSCGLGLSPSVKSAVWENLLKVPVLEFHLRNAALPAADPSIQCVEGAEKMKLKLVAKESLRDNFVGLYDAQSATSNISSRQRSTLERLAAARDDGIIQNQLAKEFNMQGKYLFYILKNLESRGLIMRQSAVVKTRDASGEEDSRNSPSVTTNIVYLSRFAKQLGPQQRIEITKEERAESSRTASGSITCGECSTIDLIEKDVTIKDYLPAMKAVCDKLELADGKVLVVTDIKHDLGYGGKSTGHRAWRTVCRRLKDAGLVEEFEAKVNEKVRPCLRLLKNFPTENNEPSLFLSGNSDRNEEVAQFGRRYQITEQVIELPLEHQVLDMIIAEGSAGLTLKEVSERLGLDNKRNHTRYLNIVSRFGLNLASENRGKCVAYRVWAPNFLWDDATNLSFPSKSKSKYIQASNCDGLESATPNLLNYNPSVSEGNIISVEEKAERETDAGHDDAHYEVVNTDKASNRPTNPEDILPEPEISGGDLQVTSVLSSDGKAGIPSETALSISHRSSKVGSAQRYPCLSLTADATQRQQRILERMQEDKFILRAELYRWLVSLEKDKCTTMDRKTIDRIVNKLQKEGHCKCVEINVPSFTNCSRSRRTQVILHPSVDNLSPPLLNDIHDRLRSFEMQSRGHGSSKLKNSKSVPVLEGVQRIQNSRVSDATTANSKHEIMRANGFVLAKMIRAKLLHCFLWDHLHSFPDNDFDSLTSASNPLCSYCQFPMEEAIKSIPVELFLQVVGSTQKFDDMMQKCKSGLRLVDLPVEQYRILMDSLATSRLSLVIDILRRLKLIRLVNDQHRGGDIEIPHAIVTHALELKPYVEEPLSILANSFSFISLDLRPRVRHDFILSSREAVDEYWQTLEYCYASADPKAATHAFPGSAVHEVFLFRAWASIRVMTAEQRAELLKRILMDFTSQKLSFKECRKIARDLNLTLEQVLRVYHDKCLKRLTRFQGSVAEEGLEGKMSANQSLSASRKRRKLSRPPLSDNIVEPVSEQLSHADTARLSDNVDCFREEHDEPVISLKEHNNLKIIEEEISIEQPGHNIENERSPNKRMKPTRQRSLWTDEADRQLVIQYIRHRAVRGAKFQRADWGSLSNLPAPPSACGKRLATLKKNRVFRKALMKLLNIVSKRYVKHLKKLHGHIGDGCISFIRSSLKGDGDRNISIEAQLTEEEWDDFSCPSINKLIEEVLRCKKITKLHASEEVQSDSSLHTNVDLSSSGYVEPLASQVRESASLGSPCESDWQDQGTGQHQGTFSRMKRRRLHRKFTKLFNEESPVRAHIYESVAVSNAVELFKLIFLNTSPSPWVSNIFAESLRHYSEHDLFAAFSYLRERKILAGGSGNQQYELSQNFIQSISRSVFPANTGRRFFRFSRWLQEREKDLNHGEITLDSDLHCGDVFHLFYLVYSGEISILPVLPEEGVGEAGELRNLKRGRADPDDSPDSCNTKKLKYVADGDASNRREKGYPGIRVCLRREAIQKAKLLELSSIDLMYDSEKVVSHNHHDKLDTAVNQEEGVSFPESHIGGTITSSNACELKGNSAETPWGAMACYAEKAMLMHSDSKCPTSLYPEVFETVCSAVQRAGDQGLSMEEVSQIANNPGEKVLELLIDVLLSFCRVIKVNAFDAVRIVDVLYRPKFYLTLLPDTFQGQLQQPSTQSRQCTEGYIIKPKKHDVPCGRSKHEPAINTGETHKVTILNLPEEMDETPSGVLKTSISRSSCHVSENPSGGNGKLEDAKFISGERCIPIAPWLNGDGTVNKVVYKGLVRRALGIVMQNPGILEEDIIRRLDVLNPQSCRTLLESMVLEKHLTVRKMRQTRGNSPPSILQSLLGSTGSKTIFREHFFANPMSARLL